MKLLLLCLLLILAGASASAKAEDTVDAPVQDRLDVLGAAINAQRIHGTASWYCSATSACTRGYSGSDLVAAIDRKDSPFRKGDRVNVCHASECVTVRVVDVCGCPGRRVIDLSSGAFRRLAPLSAGVIPVTLEAAGRTVAKAEPKPTLPQTDTLP